MAIAAIAAIAAGAIVSVAAWHVLEVALTPVDDDLRTTSCVIVLGAAVWNGEPSPVYQGRLRWAVERVGAGQLFLTGGVGDGDARSEAAVGRDFARAHGIDGARIIVEERSRTTAENLANAAPLLPRDEACALVSDPLHLPRALVLAREAGVRVFPSATPYTRYVSTGPRVRMLLSEAWHLFTHRLD